MSKRDVQQEITNLMIELMEQGVDQWRKPWKDIADTGLPINGVSKKAYRGINILTLWASAHENGYISPYWFTYKQAAELGGQVRKGEKSTVGFFWKIVNKDSESEEFIDDKETTISYPIARTFYLFNAQQIDGLAKEFYCKPTNTALDKFERIEAADLFVKNTQARIVHGNRKAYFSPSIDEIHLPDREMFLSEDNYYATLFHELTHWTGHESRLDRQFGKRFGDDAYAFEELVAELGSAFLAGSFGITGTVENHASYLKSWLRVLKNDKNAIFKASASAQKAFDFLSELGQPENQQSETAVEKLAA